MISFGSEVLSFDVVEFLESPVETDLFAHLCGEKCLYQFSGDRIADYSSADAEYVHVVMYYALRGRIGVVAHRGAHASELVRGYCGADAAAAQHDASVGVAGLDRSSYWARCDRDSRLLRRIGRRGRSPDVRQPRW